MDRLAEFREERGLTLRELSKMSGVSPDTINQIELGHRKARPSTLRKLAKSLDVKVEDFFKDGELTKGPKFTSWFEPDNADQLDAELKARGFDLLAMDSDEFKDYAKDKSYKEVARQAWAEWVKVRDNPELQHLKSLANHRVATHLTYLPGPTAPARPSPEFVEFIDELDEASLGELENDLKPVEIALNKEGDPNFEKVGIHRFITGLKGQVRRGSAAAEESLERELQTV